jgi:hypothetical protein
VVRFRPAARLENGNGAVIDDKALWWFAGVLDSGGSIIRKNNKMRKTPQIVLIVESRHTEVINKLCALTGISPDVKPPRTTNDWARKGCTEHCPKPHVEVHIGEYIREMPSIARWAITGAGAAVVLYNLLPKMFADAAYANIVNEILDNTPLTGQGSGATVPQIKRLSELGWKLPQKFKHLEYIDLLEKSLVS